MLRTQQCVPWGHYDPYSTVQILTTYGGGGDTQGVAACDPSDGEGGDRERRGKREHTSGESLGLAG